MRPTWMAIGLLLVAGCVPRLEPQTGLGTWAKPGATQTAINQDSEACQEETRYPSYEDPSLFRGVLQSVMRMDPVLYAACMRERGYRRVDVPPVVTPGGDR